MAQINLDDLGFRPDSKAREVAAKLLTGRPMTRQELVGGEVSITTVNRVVQMLEDAGTQIVRDVDGRQAVFQVVQISQPKRRLISPQLDERGRLVKDELVGDEHVIEFTTEGGKRFRGVLSRTLTNIPPVGTEIQVSGISRAEGRNDTTVILETVRGSKRLKVEATQNVSN